MAQNAVGPLYLVTAEGVQRGQAVAVRTSKFVIGRDDECDLRPNSSAVSRRHCEVRVNRAGFWLRDLGSTNGTVLNGTPVGGEWRQLRDGDRLEIGPLAFSVQSAPPGAGPPESAAGVGQEADETAAPGPSGDVGLSATAYHGPVGDTTPAGGLDPVAPQDRDRPDDSAADFNPEEEAGAAVGRRSSGPVSKSAKPVRPTAGDDEMSRAADSILRKMMQKKR